MKRLIKRFDVSGICEVYVEKVINFWSDKFSISQYHDTYTLIIINKAGTRKSKTQISQGQAHEIINHLDLVSIQSSLFTYAKTYKDKQTIESEKEKAEQTLKNTIAELQVINSYLNALNDALVNHDNKNKGI